MTALPAIDFFLYRTDAPVFPGHPSWETSLPLSRDAARVAKPASSQAVTFGQVLSAAGVFLKKDNFKQLRKAAAQIAGRQIACGDIRQIRTVLVKHGEFYHPIRVELDLADRTVMLALNIAISANGRKRLPGETQVLERLAREMPFGFLPEVFARGEVDDPQLGRVPMFLASWFEGYHEFHLSCQGVNRTCIRVWDDDKGAYFLNEAQTHDLYRQMGLILTAYVNLDTFEHIHPFSNAAGDFVVKAEDKGLRLRLITARGYGSLMAPVSQSADQERSVQDLFDALIAFLLNMSLNLRIDRLDGTGDMAFAHEAAVAAIFEGFLDGLMLKLGNDARSQSMSAAFLHYVKAHGEDGLIRVGEHLLALWPAGAPERQIAEAHLPGHVSALLEAAQNTAP